MQIAPELFEQVISALDVAADQALGAQRRQPRAALSRRLTIIPCPRGVDGLLDAPLSVPMRDLSSGGVGFLLPRRLALDTQFILLLPRPHASLPIFAAPQVSAADQTRLDSTLALLCAISYWQPVRNNLFALGARFERVVESREIPAPMPQPRPVLFGVASEDIDVAGVIAPFRAAS